MSTSHSAENAVPSFDRYIESVRAARYDTFLARAQTRVGDESSFARMKQHVVKLYDGVSVDHTFSDENGQIFDCIPVEQQPSIIRAPNKGPAAPPELPAAPASPDAPHDSSPVEPQLAPERTDAFGNRMWCPHGLIPFRRISLEELSRFESLDHFFRKSPVGSRGRHPLLSAPAATHKYAHAYQIVNNLGGHSFLNVWKPSIGANQVFSLSQHWYASGTGNAVQTVEAGWQVYPGKYNNSNPVLFIYWTADGYQKTGCYNLECTAFVQTNNKWTLGGSLGTSKPGGTQVELEIAWFLSGGNWWLFLNGTPLGYYPGNQYNQGPLATAADSIDYGGETVGTATWPPMGSGAFANAGYKNAAYQRTIYYFGLDRKAQWAKPIGVQTSPSCYTIAVSN